MEGSMERSPRVPYQTRGRSPSVFLHIRRHWGCVPNGLNMPQDSQAQAVFLALFPRDVVTGKEGKLWETMAVCVKCVSEVFWTVSTE